MLTCLFHYNGRLLSRIPFDSGAFYGQLCFVFHSQHQNSDQSKSLFAWTRASNYMLTESQEGEQKDNGIQQRKCDLSPLTANIRLPTTNNNIKLEEPVIDRLTETQGSPANDPGSVLIKRKIVIETSSGRG